jgi:hypothetical protein
MAANTSTKKKEGTEKSRIPKRKSGTTPENDAKEQKKKIAVVSPSPE